MTLHKFVSIYSGCAKFVAARLAQQTRGSAIVGLMLVQRLRRWPNIKPTMSQRLLFAGNCCF